MVMDNTVAMADDAKQVVVEEVWTAQATRTRPPSATSRTGFEAKPCT